MSGTLGTASLKRAKMIPRNGWGGTRKGLANDEPFSRSEKHTRRFGRNLMMQPTLRFLPWKYSVESGASFTKHLNVTPQSFASHSTASSLFARSTLDSRSLRHSTSIGLCGQVVTGRGGGSSECDGLTESHGQQTIGSTIATALARLWRPTPHPLPTLRRERTRACCGCLPSRLKGG